MGDNVLKFERPMCRARFGVHPTMQHLVSLCALPKGHDGDHDNRLTKPEERILRQGGTS